MTPRELLGVLAFAGRSDQPEPRVAVQFVPGGGCALYHAWATVAKTGRHHYDQCACGARRIVDQFPLELPTDLLDVSWACRRDGAVPDLDRCARLLPLLARG